MQSGLAMRRTVGAVCSHFLFTYFQEQIGLMYTVWFGCNYPCLYWYSLCYPFLYLSIFFNSLGIASSPKVNQAIYVYQNIRQKASLQIFSEVKCSCQLSRKQTQKKIITVGKTENQKSFDNDMPLCWSCKQKQDLLRVLGVSDGTPIYVMFFTFQNGFLYSAPVHTQLEVWLPFFIIILLN